MAKWQTMQDWKLAFLQPIITRFTHKVPIFQLGLKPPAPLTPSTFTHPSDIKILKTGAQHATVLSSPSGDSLAEGGERGGS